MLKIFGKNNKQNLKLISGGVNAFNMLTNSSNVGGIGNKYKTPPDEIESEINTCIRDANNTDSNRLKNESNEMSEHESNKIVEEILNDTSECHLASNDREVCSPPEIINEMKTFLKENGTNTNTNDKKSVLNKMYDITGCNTESCVLNDNGFQEKIGYDKAKETLMNFFKPKGPANHFGLLSNFDIDGVLQQMAIKYKNQKFLHIKFQMIDFEKKGTELSKCNLHEEFKKYNTFGCVLNTDKSTGRGIHWFCIFGKKYSQNNISLEYFNSSGLAPLPEVQAWLCKTKHQLEHSRPGCSVTIKYSVGLKYQNDNHSCGVYCLTFILLRLNNVPYKWFSEKTFYDEIMHQMRSKLFIPDK